MIRIYIAFSLLTFLISCKPSNDTIPVSNKLAVIQVKKAFDNKNKWLVEDNKDSLATVIHKGVVYGHSNCWVQTAEDITVGNPNDSLSYLSIDVDEVNVDVIEQTGIVQGVGQFVGLYKQDTFSMSLCFVETYAFVKNSWMLVGRQSAKVPPVDK